MEFIFQVRSIIGQTNTLQMFDNNGDSVYTIVVPLNQNTYYEYKFINGNNWGNDEYLAFWQIVQMLVTDF